MIMIAYVGYESGTMLSIATSTPSQTWRRAQQLFKTELRPTSAPLWI